MAKQSQAREFSSTEGLRTPVARPRGGMATPVTPSDQRKRSFAIDFTTTDVSAEAVPTYDASFLTDIQTYSDQYTDIYNHLSSAKQWSQQLTEKLRLSQRKSETRRLQQALQIVQHLRLLCIDLLQLLINRDSRKADRECFTTTNSCSFESTPVHRFYPTWAPGFDKPSPPVSKLLLHISL